MYKYIPRKKHRWSTTYIDKTKANQPKFDVEAHITQEYQMSNIQTVAASTTTEATAIKNIKVMTNGK